ncbi:SDR family NAD(P)-dependent oxidoreductase (plasmid) [Streptomyces sp. BI20]|uniref:SDR family NAD(P)-dependent oxidoreductase n=1 Tax=Streptomyces sp. BI20 TaxID=3403460 RepID=UPI003C759A57
MSGARGILDGRVALVTGGSRGIGAAVALGLGRHGAAVAVNYVRARAAAEEVAAGITAAGSRALAVQGDAGDPAAVERMVAETREGLGVIDVLVCNAVGATEEVRRRPVLESRESVDALVRRTSVQLECTLTCCHAVLPGMRARGGGSIVLIGAARASEGGTPGLAEIAVAKAAQDTLGRILARELGPDGIRVNTVAPGFVPTDANAGPGQEELAAAVAATTPLGRLTLPEDVAEVVAMLAGDATRRVTGTHVAVDGGRGL